MDLDKITPEKAEELIQQLKHDRQAKASKKTSKKDIARDYNTTLDKILLLVCTLPF